MVYFVPRIEKLFKADDIKDVFTVAYKFHLIFFLLRSHLTENLSVRRLLTDNLSIRRLLTHNMSVRRGLTKNVSLRRLLTESL